MLLRKIVLTGSLVALLGSLFWAGAQPKAPEVTDINNLDDALRFLDGGDGTAQIKQGDHRWEFIRHGGDVTIRKVDQQNWNLRDGRFQVFSAMTEKNELDKLKSFKEFQAFLANPGRKVAAICFIREDVAYIAEKDAKELSLAKLYDKPKTMSLDDAVKGYQEICYSSCKTNLRNIATACELFSKENGGHYPRKLELLTPTYLKSLPPCPGAEHNTYIFDVTKEPDRFTLVCSGHNHKGFCKPDFPQYSSKDGLKEDG